MAASTYFAQVQQLYIAYFGRPADPTGQAYWAANIDAAKGDISAVIAGFSASKESAELFGNKSTIDKVTAIYQNAFGRAPEPAGLAYWVAQLDSGKVSQAQASWTIQQNAGEGDAAVVQNKLTAAQAFTAKLDTTAAITGYQGADAAQMARDFLKDVTADNATATAAVEGAATAIEAIVAVGDVGATLVLTSGIDVLKGTNANDIFIAGDDAGAATLNSGDTINGGTGINTLKIFNATVDNAAQFENATITNVENVEVTFGAGGTALNVSGNAGVQKVTVVGGTGGTTQLNLKQQAGVTGTVSSATTFAFQGATGTADTAALALNNANIASSLTIADIETLNIAATGSNSVANLDAAAATKLVITGAGSLTTKLVGTVTQTIDGSAATGNLAIDNSAAAAGVQDIKTGEGNDTYISKFASLAKESKIDLGAGVNTLIFNDNVKIDSSSSLGITNVQVIKAVGTGAFAVDGSQVSVANFEVATTGIATFSNLAQNSTVTLDALTIAASTAGMKLGADTLNLNLVGETAAAVNAVAGVEVTGSSVVNVNTAGKGFGPNVLKLTAADNNTINVSGSQDLTLTTVNKGGVTGLTIDGSTFTGKLNVTGTAQADIIKGGSGDDTLISGGGADVLTGGAGKDIFNVTASTYGTEKTISTITDFVKGTDMLITGAVPTALAKVTVTDATLDAALATIAAQAATAGTAAWGVFGGNTYVVVDADGTAAVDANDVVVKLAGTLDLGTTAAAVFAA